MSEALRIIPLGGLGEVGKNMTVYELGDERIVVDAGLAFPRDEHLGVDLLLPDIGYLAGRSVRAVVLTHGHEDHVGGLPYLLREVDVEAVIATPLTLRIFASEIAAQMNLDNAQAAQVLAEQRRNDPRVAELETVKADIARYEGIVAGNVTYSSPLLTQAQTEFAAAEADLAAKRQAYDEAG